MVTLGKKQGNHYIQGDRYVQGDRYIQVNFNFAVNIRQLKILGSWRVTSIYRSVIYSTVHREFDGC